MSGFSNGTIVLPDIYSPSRSRNINKIYPLEALSTGVLTMREDKQQKDSESTGFWSKFTSQRKPKENVRRFSVIDPKKKNSVVPISSVTEGNGQSTQIDNN